MILSTLLFVVSDIVVVAVVTGAFSIANMIIGILVKAKVESYKKEVDGMKKELVEAVKGRGEAEGSLKELKDTVKDVKAETIVVTTDKANVTSGSVVVEHKPQ